MLSFTCFCFAHDLYYCPPLFIDIYNQLQRLVNASLTFAITTVSSLSRWPDSHCLKRGCTSSRVAIDWGGASLNGNSHCLITVNVR